MWNIFFFIMCQVKSIRNASILKQSTTLGNPYSLRHEKSEIFNKEDKSWVNKILEMSGLMA